MEVILTPEYHDLFPKENDNLDDLLKDIPSFLIIQLIAMLNAELYANDKGNETQLKIFNLLLGLQSPTKKMEIMENAMVKIKRNPKEQVNFFSILYNMNFLHYELTNFRDLPVEDLTPLQELNVFKAYFLIVETINKDYRETITTLPDFDDAYFGKMTWPTLIDQFELNYHPYPYGIMVRGAVFFNYLQVHSKYSIYVHQYLQQHNKQTALNYLFDIYQLLIAGYQKTQRAKSNEWASFSTSISPGFETLLAQFSLNQKEYERNFINGKSNYSGIKSKPLFRYDDNSYLVLSWGFLANKMYEGLVFDFYLQSGISEHPDFKQFPDFKRFVGGEITEQYLSRKLLRAVFQNRYGTLLFDDHKVAGFPDAYYRKGNTIIIFEIKDAYFPASAINAFSYEAIIRAIDQKMNNEGKGTGQIIKQLVVLSQTSFERPQMYKAARNLVVYPVIIYSDLMFNMPGVDQYLANAFHKKVQDNGLQKHFKKIKPLTFINLSFLIRYFDLLEKPGSYLTELIDYYNHQITTKKKRVQRTREMYDHLQVYQTFEVVTSHLLPIESPKRDYIAATINTLDLSEALPRE